MFGGQTIQFVLLHKFQTKANSYPAKFSHIHSQPKHNIYRSMTTSPPPKHLRAKPPHKWRVDGKINHEVRALDLIDDKAKELDRISKMYNMTEMAPSIASSTVHMISPYATDLAELRLSRLRIEEDHLLEAKRLAEIERLRGPSEKWYVHLYTFL